jgi:hypothetical protein
MLLASQFTLACKVTVSWAQIDSQKGDLTGIKWTSRPVMVFDSSTPVMLFDRVRLESR